MLARAVRAADALLGAAVIVLAEFFVVFAAARTELAGTWEAPDALVTIAPITWVMSVPLALVGAMLLGICERQRPRIAMPLFGAAFGAAVGWGISTGRHFAAVPIRAVFVGALSAAAALVFFLGARVVTRLATAPKAAALAAAALAVVLEVTNRWVLVRLYPAMHVGLAALTVMLAPGVALAWRAPARAAGLWRSAGVFAAFALSVARIPSSARILSRNDNIRLIALRGPLLGHGTNAAAAISAPPPLQAADQDTAQAAPARRQIDFSGRDIVLLTIDALRADHVGAYGYQRATTPNLDALANDGLLFLHAYCPTPHTSHSLTSLMTGKNLRPLLLQGLGADSDTWAGLLRSYGFRTAAFYPPAVFFIDQDMFVGFRDRRLDFEYSRVEFIDPPARATQVEKYLDGVPPDRRVFLWVHFFEPHEPYVHHAEHQFGDRDIDRYDSEIAFADGGLGTVVATVRARRPGAIIIATSDHGEEFGEHGGRYHGTTVYDEQVRVPLIISAPGLVPPGRVETPVQTIDLLPTVLGALDIPRPARLRGTDLGTVIAGRRAGEGRAFSETDDQTLLAEAQWRLTCVRRLGACSLYDLDLDPTEQRDVSRSNPDRAAAMKDTLRRIEASHGRFEKAGLRSEGRAWPDAIRRGIAGDADAAREVAALLDDTDVVFRRKAAEVLFDLKRAETAPDLRLALSRDEDDIVKRFCTLALTRLGDGSPRTLDLIDDADITWRRLAALALAEHGDGRAASVLVEWWRSGPPPFVRARELLAAIAVIRSKEAVLPLADSLGDVRLRPYIAQTLAAIGSPLGRQPLARAFAEERYQNTRGVLAEALVHLGAKYELVVPLVRFLGTPDPLPNGLDLAMRAGILAHVGGPGEKKIERLKDLSEEREISLLVPKGGNGAGLRLIARARTTDGRPGRLGLVRSPVAIEFAPGPAAERHVSLPEGMGMPGQIVRLVLEATSNLAVEAVAVVPLSDELPPPPPEPWTPDPAGD
jgi:arylsulfatase A-like enzyme